MYVNGVCHLSVCFLKALNTSHSYPDKLTIGLSSYFIQIKICIWTGFFISVKIKMHCQFFLNKTFLTSKFLFLKQILYIYCELLRLISVLGHNDMWYIFFFFYVLSYELIIVHLLSDKAITAPNTHISNANSVQTPSLE